MSASVEARYYTGASPGTAGSNVIGVTVRHKRADNAALDSNNPIPKPPSGENLGWRKHCKVNFLSTPSGAISNLRWFISGTVPTGIKHYSKTLAIYTPASASDESGIAGFTDTQPNKDSNDETQRTSSSPLVVNAGTVLSNPDTGEGTQDYVVSQLGCKPTYAGGAGAFTPFSGNFRYAET